MATTTTPKVPADTELVYLLCFETPFKHARHYLGWSQNAPYRLAHHRAGSGARLTAAVAEAGGRWIVSRVWLGATRTDERRLKNRKEAPALCPVCTHKVHACFDCGRLYKHEGWLRRHHAAKHPA